VNFLYRIPVWCVSIAVEDADGALVGVIHDPNRNETFTARRGGGAFLNRSAIKVSDQADLAQALIGTGFSYEAAAREVQAELAARVLPRARDIRRGGSAAIDLSSLACGRLDGFYEAPMERWDKAAGVLIASEAGARMTELPPPQPGLPPGVIGANPTLHRALSELLLA
jgi:myo-inositol-1(or 4)-monophosphatase